MFLLLLVAGMIHLLLGDINDALMLLGFVCMMLGFTIYQVRKTKRVLAALQVLDNKPTPLQKLILVNRFWQPSIFSSLNSLNRALWWVAGGALSFLLLTLNLTFLRKIFHFVSLPPDQLTLSFAEGLCSVLWFELLKLIRRH